MSEYLSDGNMMIGTDLHTEGSVLGGRVINDCPGTAVQIPNVQDCPVSS